MIRVSVTAINPFFKQKNGGFLSLYEYFLDLTQNKAYEFQASKGNRDLFGVTLDLSWVGSDHAGAELELCLLGYAANFRLYDKRHWNYDEGRWMTPEEQRAEFDNYS